MKKAMKLISAALAVIVLFSCVNVFADAGYIKTFDLGSLGSTSLNVGVIDRSDVLWLWGDNHHYQLCNGTQDDYVTPIRFMENVKSITTEKQAYAAIKHDNSLWMWGFPRLIHWSEEDSGQKTPLKVMDDVKAVDIGSDIAGVIKTDDSLWLWGYNGNGEKGDGTINLDGEYFYPTKVMDNVSSFEIGYRGVAAIKNDGSLWVWGDYLLEGVEGQQAWTPLKIMENVKQVCFDKVRLNFYILKNDDTLWSGLQESKKILDDVSNVSLYDNTVAAIKKDGSLWCWGSNSEGRVGAGIDEKTSKTINSPVKIMDDVAMVRIAGTCGAVKNDGSLWLWGSCGASEKSGMTALGLHLDTLKNNKTQGYIPYPVEYKGLKVKLAYNQSTYTISFELGGGTGTTKTLCSKGELLTPPDNPYKDGYYFAGWYKDSACTKAWNFDTDKVNSDCTLYAKWLPKSTVTVIADPSTQNIIIDGEEVVLNTYILRDAQGFDVNFVKLRDVAYLLNKTKANFNVDWRNNAIRLDKRKEYTTQNGAELTVPTVVSAPTKTSITPVLTDGVTAPLEAFLLIDDNGGGHNYFKLRDIGKVAGFNVEWDSEKSCIVVTTTESYKE